MRILLTALLFITLGFAGCSDDSPDGAGDGTPSTSNTGTPTGQTPGMGTVAPVTHESIMRNNLFVPADFTVNVGDTIHWVTEDVQAHNVVSDSEAATFRSEDVSVAPVVGSGTEFSYTFTKAGVVDYVCEYHPGMDGTVTVQNQTA